MFKRLLDETSSTAIVESDGVEIDRRGRVAGFGVSLQARLALVRIRIFIRISWACACSVCILISKGKSIAMLLHNCKISLGNFVISNHRLGICSAGKGDTRKKGNNTKSGFNGHFNNLLKILYERALAHPKNEHLRGSLQ